MGGCTCLRWVGRITYYVGWLALLCGGLLQLKIARALFMAVDLSKRNLFEVSMAFFVICIASELRACNTTCTTCKNKEVSGDVKKAS
jgi:hypothetical protein